MDYHVKDKIEMENRGRFISEYEDCCLPQSDYFDGMGFNVALSHPDYTLYSNVYDQKELEDDETRKRVMTRAKRACLSFPVRIYDHSGIAFSIDNSYPFNCSFDSSLVGFIWFTKTQMKQNFKNSKDTATKAVESFIEMYNAFHRGDVLTLTYKDYLKDTVDHCGGYLVTDFEDYKRCAEDFLSEQNLKPKHIKQVLEELT